MCSSEASQRRAIADSMPAPEKPPNLVIYMPQLHLSDSLLAEAIVEFFKSRMGGGVGQALEAHIRGGRSG